MTSHAAVVARGMGRPCVAGAGSITVDYAAAKLTVGSVTVTEGQILTIDGSKGEVMVGEVPTVLWRYMSNDFSMFNDVSDSDVKRMFIRITRNVQGMFKGCSRDVQKGCSMMFNIIECYRDMKVVGSAEASTHPDTLEFESKFADVV